MCLAQTHHPTFCPLLQENGERTVEEIDRRRARSDTTEGIGAADLRRDGRDWAARGDVIGAASVAAAREGRAVFEKPACCGPLGWTDRSQSCSSGVEVIGRE